ncbi:MAG: hypothetical protein V1815_00845 [Candidatus Woesearchaeota archaeon]
MYTIKFGREHEGLEDSLFGMAVERILIKDSIFIDSYRINSSLKDIEKGLYGSDNKIFEIKNQGTIIYQKFNTLLGYYANILLIGFDEEKSEAFRELKGKLEELLMTDDIKIIKSKFLAKK